MGLWFPQSEIHQSGRALSVKVETPYYLGRILSLYDTLNRCMARQCLNGEAEIGWDNIISINIH